MPCSHKAAAAAHTKDRTSHQIFNSSHGGETLKPACMAASSSAATAATGFHEESRLRSPSHA